LESLGYKYSGESGVIRVCKGSLVVMKGNHFDGLSSGQCSYMFGCYVFFK